MVSPQLLKVAVWWESSSPQRGQWALPVALRVDFQTSPQRREEQAAQGQLASVRTARKWEKETLSLSPSLPCGFQGMGLLLSHCIRSGSC